MGYFMIFGDICPDNNYRSFFDHMQLDLFDQNIRSDMMKASVVSGNLECPATKNSVPIVKCGPNLRAEPGDIDLLSRLGFQVLSIGNNHILDYGILSAEETIQLCKEKGITTVGAGKNAHDAAQPILLSVDGKRIGIASFAEAEFNLAAEAAPGANLFDPYTSFSDVKKLKEQADYVIVLYHGGIEYYHYPSPLLQKKCRGLVEAGADLVLCQHSHCIGTTEIYCGKTILYGQGNSVFGFKKNNQSWNEGLVAFVDLDSCEIRYKLLEATENGIRYADPGAEKQRIRQMMEESSILQDQSQIRFRWEKFCQTQAALDLPLLLGKNRIYTKLNRILKNRLIERLISRKRKMATMNLIRCEAHHEVIQTILENEIFH